MNQEQIADKWTNKELERLEKRISREYEKAQTELSKKASDYFKQYASRWQKENLALETTRKSKDDIKAEWVKLYKSEAGFETWYKTANKAYGNTWQEAKENFKRWEYAQLGRGQHWVELKDQMAKRLVESDKIAEGYINGILPSVYIKNNNAISTLATQSAIEQGIVGIKFDLVDEYTVKNLMQSSSEVRPYKPVVISIDKNTRYSKNKLQNALLQGILQGDSIDKIADRFETVTGMSRNTAIRNARTAVTGARSKGKQDRYKDLADKGCIISKVWLATDDDRTREEHMEADGQEVDYNEPFEVGGEELMYPADHAGSGWNIYNCRCTMHTGEIRFKSVLDFDAGIRIV